MGLLEGHVREDPLEPLALLRDRGEDAGLEQELFEFDEHPPFLQVLRVYTPLVDGLQLVQVGRLEDSLDLLADERVEGARGGGLQGGEVLVGLREVGGSQFVIGEKLLEALVESLLATLMLLHFEEVLSRGLDGQGSVSDVNAMFPESLFELDVKVFAHFRLRSRLLIYPEANLITELLIVESGWQHGFLDEIQLHLLRPLIRLKVAVDLFGTDVP